ncbi:MAG: inositol monophosphatase family protein [Acidobacteriota bacterium]
MSTDPLAVAQDAARAGGAVIAAARSERSFSIKNKAPADFVTEVDVAAEKAVLEVLTTAFPDHAVLAEESGAKEGAESGHCWVIDPLDGTTNFIRDLPAFAVSVGLEHEGRPVVAAVYDVAHDELYSAARGQGAHRDGQVLRVSTATEFAEGLHATGIPFRELTGMPEYLRELEAMAMGSCGIRRMGSAALDLCHVAAGRMESFWEHGLSRWDISAGSLIVEEAGGTVSDLDGAQGHLDSGDILATNGLQHAALLERLKTARES